MLKSLKKCRLLKSVEVMRTEINGSMVPQNSDALTFHSLTDAATAERQASKQLGGTGSIGDVC